MYIRICTTYVHVSTVNTHQSAAICFQRMQRVNELGGLTGYSLVLVHYIGKLENCGGLKGLADKAVED